MAKGWIGDEVRSAIGDPFPVKKFYQPAVCAVADPLGDWPSRRGNDGAARRHRLEERPGEDERVGEIDVDGRDLEEAPIVGIGDPPEEVDALRVEPGADLTEHPLAP